MLFITLDLCLISFADELHLVHESSTALGIFSYSGSTLGYYISNPPLAPSILDAQRHIPEKGEAGRVIPYGSRLAHCSWQKLAMIA